MKKYSKLEVIGEWSSIDSTNSKQVNISFGSISLNILDTDNDPISQWAYGSVILVEMNIDSAVFSPDEEQTEHLAIFDADAVKYLLSLSKKKVNSPFKRILKSILLICLIIICASFFYKYHRISLEKIALSITSHEQENFIGSLIFTNLKEFSLCNSESSNRFISALIEEKMKADKSILKVRLLSSYRKYSLLLPGGILLIPNNMINEANGLTNFEMLVLNSLKSQKEQRPIKVFFSNQKTIDLVYYILGYFESLNFTKNIQFKLENLNLKIEDRLDISDKQWMKIRALCS